VRWTGFPFTFAVWRTSGVGTFDAAALAWDVGISVGVSGAVAFLLAAWRCWRVPHDQPRAGRLPEGLMHPEELQRALEGGGVVQTCRGSGPAIVRRLADLVLVTGRVLIGYPGSPLVNEPSPVRPLVAPGRYPVFASLADVPGGHKALAFVVLRFEEAPPLSWEEAGSFFTDSGTGCLMDEGAVPLLEKKEAAAEFWRVLYDLKCGVFGGGDCSLVLDDASRVNAIVFKTDDARYPCFLGRQQDGRPAWLVVDCR
jgi:hypothetical protein